MLAKRSCILISDLICDFSVLVWHFLLRLRFDRGWKLDAAGEEHLHPYVETDLIALLLRRNHVVRYNVPSLGLAKSSETTNQNFTIEIKVGQKQITSYLQWLVFHALVVLRDAKLATLARLVAWLVLAVAGLNEFILLPETIRFVVPCNFVFEARMLHLEFEDVVKVEVRWLELDLAQDGLIVFLDLLQLIHSLLSGR